MHDTYIALYPVAQSTLQNFVGDFARLLIYSTAQIYVNQKMQIHI